VKPENVLLSDNGDAKLADFGLARFRGRRVKTATGILVGTPEFLAPEILKGEQPTAPSDIYAWGCMVYALVNGSPPVTGNLSEVVQGCLRGDWKPGAETGPLANACHAALCLAPTDRANATELAGILASKTASQARRSPSSMSEPVLKDRLAATRAMNTVSGATPLRAVPRRQYFGAVIAVVSLAVLAGWFTGEESSPAPPTPPPSTSDGLPPETREELAELWGRRSFELDAAAVLGRLDLDLRAVIEKAGLTEKALDERGTVKAMQLQRRARATGLVGLPGVQETLRKRADELPLRSLLARDHGALSAVLGDNLAPYKLRRSLHRALAPLAQVDAYFSAWGEPPPYQAEDLRHRLVPRQELPVDQSWEEVSDAPATPAPPGRHRVHRWPFPENDFRAVLVADPLKPLPSESPAWLIAGMNAEDHAELRGTLVLSNPPPSHDGALALEVTLANHILPKRLLLRWNELDFEYRSSPESSPGSAWKADAWPAVRVRFELPAGCLIPGKNYLEVRSQPPPGIPHGFATNIGWVGVELTVPG
jgi:hypothetical protein